MWSLQVKEKMPVPSLNPKFSLCSVFLSVCLLSSWPQLQSLQLQSPLCVEMTILISLSVTGGIFPPPFCFSFQASSVLCVKFLHTVGLSSQLVSGPCGDPLSCFCENSLYQCKVGEAEVGNKQDAARNKRADQQGQN